ncbi:hypothetical protein P153DRAFT_177516 [Dothidotthia symphoricarpi CBS 119687]|uniref:Uncharacterized protein n=1 Tax=Dothidotthia symphoricarpi CBS 119687 TaxID=1392245 RepID=A0A6A6ALW2_9PLEO|nr:uncharacterized protein P153DRAFT_177516 [Dothidotthia symphoricarpi CBS 119687]KAF2132972.1 hypothetical protein P153DRAFT_177516 [Dothidotthia symphoricarpi CBS 119687]
MTTTSLLLAKLPAEIIEMILLETVQNEIIPPIRIVNGESVVRWKKELEVGHSLAISLLEIRLVCRTFRDLSWQVFGEVLGETLFDIRSKESFANLMAASECKELASWTTKLTITCCNVEEDWMRDMNPFFYANAGESIQDEIQRIKQAEQSWFPQVWSYALDLERIHVSILARSLAGCLRNFRKIRAICYQFDDALPPQRYRNILRHSLEVKLNFTMYVDTLAGTGAQVGLKLFVEALASAGTTPRQLELAVEFPGHDAFITYASTQALSKVFQHVEELYLKNAYLSFHRNNRDPSSEPTVTITKSLFPALRSLTVDRFDTLLKEDAFVAPLASSLDPPTVTCLRISRSHIDRLPMISGIANCRKSLQRLTLDSDEPARFDRLSMAIDFLRLEVLEIRQGSDKTWKTFTSTIHRSRTLLHKVLEDFSRLPWEEVTRHVVLGPPAFVEALEMHQTGVRSANVD